MEDLCIYFNTMMVEFYVVSTFSPQFWGFSVPWKGSNEKNVPNVVRVLALFCAEGWSSLSGYKK